MRLAVIAAVVGTVVSSGDRTSGCSGQSSERTIRWDASADIGDFGVDVVGCRDWDVVRGVSALTVDPGWDGCALQAWRRDGQLVVRSEPVRLEGGPTPLHVDWAAQGLPTGPIGGMGVAFQPRGHDVRIERVVAGSPAEMMGLRPGDRILRVNRESTQGMGPDAFVRRVTGAPGSVVELSVVPAHASACGHGSVETVQLVRERIP